MLKLLKVILSVVVIPCSLYAAQTQAKPVVLVSIEPLYEIVTALMKGVAEPQVLINNGKIDQQLTNTQIKQLLSADMLIRVGDGIESQLGESLHEELPLVTNYTITLSNYMPLLLKSGLSSKDGKLFSSDRQKNYDLRFWMDPKLLSMSVRYIAPQLVRMDPEHQEQYLDNEIVLLKQIKEFSKLTARTIQKMSDTDKVLVAQASPYLAHRFIQDESILNRAKLSSISSTVCKKKEQLELASFSLSAVNIHSNIAQLMGEFRSCNSSSLAVRDN